ncbi:MAG: T9SS type A sorting domain-containing protein [Flavipsychrobacter sp.]
MAVSPSTGVFPGTTVTYTATVIKGGLLPVFQWFKNNTLIPGAASNVYITNTVTPADVIKVLVHSSAPCVNPDTASASAVVLTVDELAGNTQAVKLYPSPNNGTFNIAGDIVGVVNNKAAVTITNVTGQLVYSAALQVSNGKVNAQLELSKDLPAGIYTLQLTSGKQTYHLKFAINR